jgi:hypothetical protein
MELSRRYVKEGRAELSKIKEKKLSEIDELLEAI